MEQLFPFILSNLFLLVFYGVYHFFLKNETFHHTNRFYLILSSLIALSIPWIDLQTIYTWFAPLKQEPIYEIFSAGEVEIFAQKPKPFLTLLILKKVYLLITFLLLIRLSFHLVKAWLIKNNTDFRNNNAFSIFGKIYVDPNLGDQCTLQEHEETHQIQKHFLDLIYFEIIKAICWLNPAAYWFSNQIKILHEYLADHEASQTMDSKYEYSVLLLTRHFGIETGNPFVQAFFKKSTLKQRLNMLAKDPSHYAAQFKYLVAVPVFFILLILSSFTWLKNIPENIKKMTITMEPAVFNNTGDDKVVVPIIREGKLYEPDTLKPEEIFTATEEMPQYEGGAHAMYKFLGENIIYPKEAQIANISGRVFVKFVIKKDGTIGDVNVLKGIGFGCDEEAVRVIKMLNKWKPARQNGKPVNIYYNMPVVFKLEGGDTQVVETINQLNKNNENVKIEYPEKPFEIRFNNDKYNDALIIVNDVEILDRRINDLDPASIASISVLKGPDAIKQYGEKGKNGVILIRTKQ